MFKVTSSRINLRPQMNGQGYIKQSISIKYKIQTDSTMHSLQFLLVAKKLDPYTGIQHTVQYIDILYLVQNIYALHFDIILFNNCRHYSLFLHFMLLFLDVTVPFLLKVFIMISPFYNIMKTLRTPPLSVCIYNADFSDSEYDKTVVHQPHVIFGVIHCSFPIPISFVLFRH
jgi:hypothetical protein